MARRVSQPACDEGPECVAKGRQATMNPGCTGVDSGLPRNGATTERNCCMSDHVPVSRPNPLLEGLFGGNMLEGTFKAVAWVAVLCVLLAWSTLR